MGLDNKINFRAECIENCPLGYFESKGTCVICHSSCLTCSGFAETDCLECKPWKVYLNGLCVDRCPFTYFLNHEIHKCEQVRDDKYELELNFIPIGSDGVTKFDRFLQLM